MCLCLLTYWPEWFMGARHVLCVCARATVLTTLPLAAGMREHPPVAVCDLPDHIERLKANDGLHFSQEYEVTLHTYLCRRASDTVIMCGDLNMWPQQQSVVHVLRNYIGFVLINSIRVNSSRKH